MFWNSVPTQKCMLRIALIEIAQLKTYIQWLWTSQERRRDQLKAFRLFLLENSEKRVKSSRLEVKSPSFCSSLLPGPLNSKVRTIKNASFQVFLLKVDLFRINFVSKKCAKHYALAQNMGAKTRGCKESILVQTHKCSLLIMGLHIFEIKLC